ncbi:MAG TPA: adenosine kinase [Geminicoccus sp.]|uniref:adenosine kinase n=1 Tax=Geminicoccus sp. TaxID=2024832 RepID=UPI002E2F1FFD|nr:adenosine kinase [Geminicoccus sp.]HEX2525201.1 adenosine kinase [Geminicoccus sp.]
MPTVDHLPAQLDVVGLGNAIVDVVADATDAQLAELDLIKGAMTLIEADRSEFLYQHMGQAIEQSGGSCANTMAALAALGARAGYVGRVKQDQLGAIFAHDIRATGVTFLNAPAADGPATARSLIFVTPDAQRTMQTYLGACVMLDEGDVDDALVARAKVTYLEGYLWDRDGAKAACLKAASIAKAHGGQLALTLSDSFCVGRWRSEFRELVTKQVDILFANESEITSLYETDDFEVAKEAVRREVGLAVLTRGPSGSIVIAGQEEHPIPPVAPARILDTTGAGDLYVAGFLYGYTHGHSLADAGRLGSACASAVIEQYGARVQKPLRTLIESSGR